MSAIPADVLARLASLSGYDQMLEMDAVCRKFNVTTEQIQAAMAQAQPSPQANSGQAMNSGYNAAGEYDPSPQGMHHKRDAFDDFAMPSTPQPMGNSPNYIQKNQLRYEYDPSEEEKQRRAQVEQAITCPACGVALGIPAIRPIKITCPQCMMESTFTA